MTTMDTLTFRQYMTIRALTRAHGVTEHTWANWAIATEAVSTTALEHPEWDMDETDTWEGWVARHG